MKKIKKDYVCHADTCKFNNNGTCDNHLDCVVIAVYDGIAQCPNYEQACGLSDNKAALAKGLIDEVKDIYFSIYNELFEECLDEELSQYEFSTDKDHNCFMVAKGSNYLQDFACDERIACLIDSYNTVIGGKPSRVTLQK